MRCDTPHKEKKFTMKFVQVNPSPFGFEFDEGDYFLICKYLRQESQQFYGFRNLGISVKKFSKFFRIS